LDKLPAFIQARRDNWQALRAGLDDLADVLILPEPTERSEPSWFGFLIAVREDAPFTRNQLTGYLEEHKIATRLLFGGNLARQPAYRDRPFRAIGDLRHSDFVMNQAFWIGVYPGISDVARDYVIETIHAAVATLGRRAPSRSR